MGDILIEAEPPKLTDSAIDPEAIRQYKRDRKDILVKCHSDSRYYRAASPEGRRIKEETYKEISSPDFLEKNFNMISCEKLYQIIDRYVMLLNKLGIVENNSILGETVEQKIDFMEKVVERLKIRFSEIQIEVVNTIKDLEANKASLENPELLPRLEKSITTLSEDIIKNQAKLDELQQLTKNQEENDENQHQ